jgi:hypothetical protein
MCAIGTNDPAHVLRGEGVAELVGLPELRRYLSLSREARWQRAHWRSALSFAKCVPQRQ